MKLIKQLTVIFFLVFTSCKPNKNDLFINLNLDEPQRLIKGEVIKFKELISPLNILFQSPYIILNDSKSKKPIHIIDIKSNKYVAGLGKKGKGPGEMLSTVSFDVFENKLWVSDLTLSKYVSFNLDSISNPNYHFSSEILFKDKARQNFTPMWLNEEMMISTTFSDSKYRLIETNNEGEITNENFLFFPPNSNDIPYSIHNQSYQSVLKVKPNKEKVVVVSRYSDLIEIYDLKTKASKLIKTHDDYSPVYEVMNVDGNLRLGQDGTMKFGYIDVSVSDTKIATLFSGRTRAEGKANFANFVYIYDWNGKYLSSFKIENRAIAIELIDENNFLVIESIKGELILKKYTI